MIFTIIFIGYTCYAYDDSPEAPFNAPYQVTWFYPIGIHLFTSTEIKYNYSINMLLGYTGGVRYFEFAGLGNINKYSSGGSKQFAFQMALKVCREQEF